MPPQDPEKRKKYQRDLMRDRRAGEANRRPIIDLGKLPELAKDEAEYHAKQLELAAKMQAVAIATFENIKEVTPGQAVQFLELADKIRQTSTAALASLNKTDDEEEGGFGIFGIELKERLQDERYFDLALGLLTYAPQADPPKRKAPAKPRSKAPAKPKSGATKKPDPGANKKAPKGKSKT